MSEIEECSGSRSGSWSGSRSGSGCQSCDPWTVVCVSVRTVWPQRRVLRSSSAAVKETFATSASHTCPTSRDHVSHTHIQTVDVSDDENTCSVY